MHPLGKNTLSLLVYVAAIWSMNIALLRADGEQEDPDSKDRFEILCDLQKVHPNKLGTIVDQVVLRTDEGNKIRVFAYIQPYESDKGKVAIEVAAGHVFSADVVASFSQTAKWDGTGRCTILCDIPVTSKLTHVRIQVYGLDPKHEYTLRATALRL